MSNLPLCLQCPAHCWVYGRCSVNICQMHMVAEQSLHENRNTYYWLEGFSTHRTVFMRSYQHMLESTRYRTITYNQSHCHGMFWFKKLQLSITHISPVREICWLINCFKWNYLGLFCNHHNLANTVLLKMKKMYFTVLDKCSLHFNCITAASGYNKIVPWHLEATQIFYSWVTWIRL